MKTRLTSQQIQIMKDDIAVDLTEHLINKFHYTPQDALDILYTSDTFCRLQDSETGLYYQSPGYIFDFLNKEITEGQMK